MGERCRTKRLRPVDEETRRDGQAEAWSLLLKEASLGYYPRILGELRDDAQEERLRGKQGHGRTDVVKAGRQALPCPPPPAAIAIFGGNFPGYFE